MPYLKQSSNGTLISVIEFEQSLSIGRSRENDIVVEDLTVSSIHAKVQKENNHWCLKDCNSTNGVLIDGKKSSQSNLHDGVRFTIGTHSFEFCLVDPGSLDKTLKIKKSWIPGVYYTE